MLIDLEIKGFNSWINKIRFRISPTEWAIPSLSALCCFLVFMRLRKRTKMNSTSYYKSNCRSEEYEWILAEATHWTMKSLSDISHDLFMHIFSTLIMLHIPRISLRLKSCCHLLPISPSCRIQEIWSTPSPRSLEIFDAFWAGFRLTAYYI